MAFTFAFKQKPFFIHLFTKSNNFFYEQNGFTLVERLKDSLLHQCSYRSTHIKLQKSPNKIWMIRVWFSTDQYFFLEIIKPTFY